MKKKKKATAIALITFVALIAITSVADILRTVGIILCTIAGITLLILIIVAIVKICKTKKQQKLDCNEEPINNFAEDPSYDFKKQQIILANIKKAFEAKNKNQETKVIQINKTKQKPAKETPKESIEPAIKVKNENINTTNLKANVVNVDNQIYVKKPLMTKCEKYFYKILVEEFSWLYDVEAQVNLAAVINKVDNSQYHNELFRNIDFGIFDKFTTDVLVLIEINDKTHEEQKRHVRDLKVRDICEQANIKLLTFYTNRPNKRDYVTRRVKEAIGQA